MKKLSITAIVSTIILTGCNTVGGYQPVIDTYDDPHASRLNQDMAECQQIAEQSSGKGSTAKDAAIGAGVGGLGGAALGAAAGAALGNAGTGAALGAAVGGIGGAAHQGLNSDSQYKHIYNNCLRQRGHKVLN